jgi:hypothetical protein
VGNPVFDVELDAKWPRRDSQIVSQYIGRRVGVKKESGEVIRTDPFTDPAYSHVSAVVYSPCHWMTHPETLGTDFTVIHNERPTSSRLTGG